MDLIRALEETSIDKINMRTLAALIPVLDKKKADIEKIERIEFKYGQKNRQSLDVYYPPAASALSTPNKKLPVLFFIYGGGYNTGSRRFPEPYEMGYRALGSFFAARGFLTVIPDYRLVPEARFPGASEDVRDAVLWVAGHAAEVASAATDSASTTTELDPGHVFILAHSAGVAHTLVMLLHSQLRPSFEEGAIKAELRVRGLVLCGSPWHFSVRGQKFATSGATRFYFGTEEQQKGRQPRGLWTALKDEDVRAVPDMLLVQAEREPDWLKLDTKDVMEEEVRERFAAVGRELQETYIAVGHNHVSINWALSTGDEEGEKWGYDVVEWIKARF